MKISQPLHKHKSRYKRCAMKAHESVRERLFPTLLELQLRFQAGATDSPIWIPASSALTWLNSFLGIRT